MSNPVNIIQEECSYDIILKLWVDQERVECTNEVVEIVNKSIYLPESLGYT